MPDLLMSVIVDRDDLGLGSLDLNDHISYYIADTFMGGSVTWNRNTISSPWVDGGVTVNRSRQMVTEQVVVEVLGTTKAILMANISALVDAFSQDTYNLQIAFGANVVQYACEAADYTVGYNGQRWLADQIQVTLSIPRQPVPVSGGF